VLLWSTVIFVTRGGEFTHPFEGQKRQELCRGHTRNVRKNQAQINAKGEKVSDYRPDAQWTDKNGVRHYYEVSSKTSKADRGRLRANDPDAIIEVHNLDTGTTVTYQPGQAIP
jgi:hypothetical protein